jgi:putative acetyltransferase
MLVQSDHLRFTIEPPAGAEIAALLAERDAHFDKLYADQPTRVRAFDLERDNVVFFTVRGDDRLLGCGALVLHPDYGELKRFYIRPDSRARGLGRRLVQAIEAEARRIGLQRLMLEVGVRHPEAASLYRSQGFRERSCFGEYRTDPLSLFMEKPL